MISVAEAHQLIAERAHTLSSETVALTAARNRRAATDILAPIDLPPFANSAMDGYALRAADVADATDDLPVRLPVTGTIAAGSSDAHTLTPRTALRIMTGAALPSGADSVLQLEHGRLRDEHVEVRAAITPGRHVRMRGEDVTCGAPIVAAGTTITTNRMALLANAGVGALDVTRRARVAVLATGAELVHPEQVGHQAAPPDALQHGQIYDSNGPVMCAMAADAGCDVTDLGIAIDDADVIGATIERALADRPDLIMLSGGVSVGRYDHVRSVLSDLGAERIFWRIRMKPGKPLLCTMIGDTWIFGLPGNPISCVAGFTYFIEPLLRVMHGAATYDPPVERAVLTADFRHDASRTVLATAHLAPDRYGQLQVTPTARQGSAMMHALAEANAFLIADEATPHLPAGEHVDVIRIP